ncbi:hypothetical protein WV31_19020 [Magnetospirillum sp. ME-1]|uniref:hypothetical protein n=1 Tax=Magnetospirillum sp. ME-1 TaxID=1639348 RepID=UPI000A17DB40|nr:hypothetical protein [Magnetospirillum sp. ME-1]ARJ67596.1 hypothetical protein WV31_19020 [Magnetospirillum sp. ME-1]
MANDDIEDISMDAWMNAWNRALGAVLVGAPGGTFERERARIILIVSGLLRVYDEPNLPDGERQWRAERRQEIEARAARLMVVYLEVQVRHGNAAMKAKVKWAKREAARAERKAGRS